MRILVDRHTSSMYRFSVRYTGDESLAEDICQEVFLKVYQYARRYKPGVSFKTWLFTIVRNTSIDLARPYLRHKRHSLNSQEEADFVEASNRSFSCEPHTPENDYVAEERASRLNQALGALPEKQRTAVILKYYEDMTNAEVAEIMHATVGSVESLIIRAKRNLIKLFDL